MATLVDAIEILAQSNIVLDGKPQNLFGTPILENIPEPRVLNCLPYLGWRELWRRVAIVGPASGGSEQNLSSYWTHDLPNRKYQARTSDCALRFMHYDLWTSNPITKIDLFVCKTEEMFRNMVEGNSFEAVSIDKYEQRLRQL